MKEKIIFIALICLLVFSGCTGVDVAQRDENGNPIGYLTLSQTAAGRQLISEISDAVDQRGALDTSGLESLLSYVDTNIWTENLLNDLNYWLGDFNATGNIYGQNIVSLGDVNATTFYGDGSKLTGISISDISCDQNNFCIITGTINSNFDANIVDLNVDDISTTGDITIPVNKCIRFNDTPQSTICHPVSAGALVITGGGGAPSIEFGGNLIDTTDPSSIYSIGSQTKPWAYGYFEFIDVNQDLNAVNIGISGTYFGDGSKLTGIPIDTNIWTEGFSLTNQNQLFPDTNAETACKSTEVLFGNGAGCQEINDLDTNCDGQTCNVTNTGTLDGYNASDFMLATIGHNDLTGLQGGTTGEYYHLTEADFNRVFDYNYAVKETNARGLYVDSDTGVDEVGCGDVNTDPCQSIPYTLVNRVGDIIAQSVVIYARGNWGTDENPGDEYLSINKAAMVDGYRLTIRADDYIWANAGDSRTNVTKATSTTVSYKPTGQIADVADGWNGSWVFINTTDDANSQVRQITDTNVDADGNITITVSPAWDVTPTPGTSKIGVYGRAVIHMVDPYLTGIKALGGSISTTISGFDFNNFSGGESDVAYAIVGDLGAFVNSSGNAFTGTYAGPEGGKGITATHGSWVLSNRDVCYKQSDCLYSNFGGTAAGFLSVFQNTGWSGSNLHAENGGIISTQSCFTWGGAYSMLLEDSIGYWNVWLYGDDGSTKGIVATDSSLDTSSTDLSIVYFKTYYPTDTRMACNASRKGYTYYDDSLSELCDCDGSSWAQVDGGGAC